jgi:hypothetical protein
MWYRMMRGNAEREKDDGDGDDDDDEYNESISKRRIRDMIRPSVAELKRRVERPDLVEAHDVTAADPEFLIQLKAVAGTVPFRATGVKAISERCVLQCTYVMLCSFKVAFTSTPELAC